jgi:hypothetical protein
MTKTMEPHPMEKAMSKNYHENHSDSAAIERLLTAATVACILGISPKTVHKLVREKKLACVHGTLREQRSGRGLIRGASSHRRYFRRPAAERHGLRTV